MILRSRAVEASTPAAARDERAGSSPSVPRTEAGKRVWSVVVMASVERFQRTDGRRMAFRSRKRQPEAGSRLERDGGTLGGRHVAGVDIETIDVEREAQADLGFERQ